MRRPKLLTRTIKEKRVIQARRQRAIICRSLYHSNFSRKRKRLLVERRPSVRAVSKSNRNTSRQTLSVGRDDKWLISDSINHLRDNIAH